MIRKILVDSKVLWEEIIIPSSRVVILSSSEQKRSAIEYSLESTMLGTTWDDGSIGWECAEIHMEDGQVLKAPGGMKTNFKCGPGAMANIAFGENPFENLSNKLTGVRFNRRLSSLLSRLFRGKVTGLIYSKDNELLFLDESGRRKTIKSLSLVNLELCKVAVRVIWLLTDCSPILVINSNTLISLGKQGRKRLFKELALMKESNRQVIIICDIRDIPSFPKDSRKIALIDLDKEHIDI
jgi:hypothetical protein